MELLLYLKDFFGENLDTFKQDLYRSHSLKLVCERIVSVVTGGISVSGNEVQDSPWQGDDDLGLAESDCKLLRSYSISEHLLQMTGIKRTETYHLPLYSASACQNSVCFVCSKSRDSGCPL